VPLWLYVTGAASEQRPPAEAGEGSGGAKMVLVFPIRSTEDRELTTRLVKAGNILGIQILDHIIIGSGSAYYSFADAGALDTSDKST
jgi:hypothetical protein